MNFNLSRSILLRDLKIYQWIFSLFGLNFPPFLIYRQQKDGKYYLVLIIFFLYSLTLAVGCIWSAHIHNVIVRGATVKHNLDGLTEVGTYLQNVTNATLQLLLLYKSWCGLPNLCELLLLIKQLEHKMLLICPQMFQQQMLRKRLITTTGLYLILLFSFLIYVNFILVASNMQLFDKTLVVFFLASVQMKFLEYGIYVQLVYEYLLMLLKSLKQFKQSVETVVDRLQPLSSHYPQTLQLNKNSLMEIWLLVYKLEKYFAWPILLLIFYNGVVILCTVSWAYVQYLYATDSKFQMFRLAYIIAILANMLLLCCQTQKCINEYQKFSHLLLNFKLYPHDKQIIVALQEYSLQLMQQTLQFTCRGYIDIDLKYYGKTVLVIFSYAFILVQFKITDLSEGAIKATRYIFGRI